MGLFLLVTTRKRQIIAAFDRLRLGNHASQKYLRICVLIHLIDNCFFYNLSMNKRDHFKYIFIVHETGWILSSLTGIFKFIYLLSRKNLFGSCFA